MSPTAEAMDTIRPVSATATTAPTSASGSVAITVNARIGDFVATRSTKNTTKSRTTENVTSVRRALMFAW